MFSFGFQGGIARRKLYFKSDFWPSHILYADVSAGLSWKYALNSKSFIQLGTAVHHANGPDNGPVIFFPGETLVEKITYHGSAEIVLTNVFSILPSFVYLNQGVHSDFRFGAANKWYYKKNTDTKFVQIGIWRRANGDTTHSGVTTIMGSAIVDLGHLQLGITYDRELNNELAAVNAYSLELMLGYVFGETKVEE